MKRETTTTDDWRGEGLIRVSDDERYVNTRSASAKRGVATGKNKPGPSQRRWANRGLTGDHSLRFEQ